MSSHNKKWKVKGKKYVYKSDWISLRQDHVVLPDGSEIPEHHVVEFPKKAVVVLLTDSEKRALLIQNYRFIVDFNGWELPAGRMETEDSIFEARRELLEETGFEGKNWKHLLSYYSSSGSTNQEFEVVQADTPTKINQNFDTNEVISMQWFSAKKILEKIENGEIKDVQTICTVSYAICKQLLK